MSRKDDAVHRVVEHHVQPLHRTHRGDLWHAQARAVVGQPDVAAHLVAHLVQRGAHQAKVLLRGIGAAKAFGGGAKGHVVQQALAGGADHRNDVGTLLGGRTRLLDVFVDVAGGHDQVEPGRAGLHQVSAACAGDGRAAPQCARTSYGPGSVQRARACCSLCGQASVSVPAATAWATC
jgi:hypothetical protein